MSSCRNQSLDALRLCVILLVLLHHTVLAYCRYGHFDHQHYLWSSAPIVDRQRWIGFDILQDFNDTYFMSLMFLVSGLFVLPGLQRKGVSRYLKDRIWRLGLPFLACATLIMPLAYYPSIRQTGAGLSFGQFWLGCFTRYEWPAGPAWFIWFLLVLDLACGILVWRLPSLPRIAAALPDLVLARPAWSLLLLLITGLAVYLPLEAVVGPGRWFSLGPFAVQESRAGLYALFFGVGAAVGAAGSRHRLLTSEGPPARHWIGLGLLAGTTFCLLLLMQLASLHQVTPWSRPSWQRLDPLLFVLCCVLSSVTLFGVFMRHVSLGYRWAARLAGDAYGIYLVHYVFLTWTQAMLLHRSWGALPKAAVVFAMVLGSSWGFTVLLRLNRTMRRIL